MPTVAFAGPRDGFVDYALALIGDWLGHELRPAERDAGEVDVLYGEDGPACKLRIPRVERYTAADVPRPDPPLPSGARTRDGEDFSFDLFAAMRFWLADEANEQLSAPEAFDPRGRVIASASAQRRTGTLERPVVNAYLLQFRAFLEARLGLERRGRLPPDKRCIVTLTHDVDLPFDPCDPRHELRLALRGARRRVRPRETVENAARRLARAAVSLREGRHWVFDEVVREEERRGFSSVFFFAATNRYEREGHKLDVGYDVRSPRFRRLIYELRARGAETGLHVGFLANGDASFIERELRRLEEAGARAPIGSRHHYFMPHPFWSTLEAHARAGLAYDTSIGFNEAPGFRLGIALPFYPWNPETQRAVACAQIPTFAMDAALFSEPGTKAGDVVAQVAGLLERLKEAEGVASLDWHEYTSYPGSRTYGEWGRAYLEVLDLLASDPEIEVQPASAVAEFAAGSPNVGRYQS